VVIRQTQTLRSEHSVVCVGLYGGGDIVGYKARWEKMCINKRDETVAKCQRTARNNKNLATSIYAALMGSHNVTVTQLSTTANRMCPRPN